jgi:hypothetical protein
MIVPNHAGGNRASVGEKKVHNRMESRLEMKLLSWGFLNSATFTPARNYLGRKHSIAQITRQRGLNSAENQKNEHDEKH